LSQRERTCHLVGWILFIVCAGFFISSAVLSGDLLYLAGSVIFLVACVAFLIPLLSRRGGRDDRPLKDKSQEADAER
jgi:TRAP-type C4-dicarboxylate transport system permease small subunit